MGKEKNNEISKDEAINLRSDVVQDIMSNIPSWIIRYGMTLIFLIIVSLFFVSWIVKYPEEINGTVQLTTLKPPIKLVSKNNGIIEHLYFTNNSKVKKGDVILSIGTTLSSEAKSYLEGFVAKLNVLLKSDRVSSLKIENTELTFGSLQEEYSILIKALGEYLYLVNEDNTSFKISNTEDLISNNKALKLATERQTNDIITQHQRLKEQLETNTTLYKQGVISKVKLYEIENKVINSKKEIEGLKKIQIQHAITISELSGKLNELEFEFQQKKKRLIQDIKSKLLSIENALNNWSLNYEVIAEADGVLSFIKTLNEGEYIKSGQVLCAIVPKNQEYVGYVSLPKKGYGKVQLNQKAFIKLDNYPFHEYGRLEGIVKNISLISSEDKYLVEIDLIKGLKTSYKKEIPYTPEMSGTADIVTEELRLIDRIFNRIRQVFDN